ncbi:MAG: hypothetical protein ACK5MT_02675 [Actinomycetales bacterium]
MTRDVEGAPRGPVGSAVPAGSRPAGRSALSSATRADAGAITAEFAIGLLSVVLVAATVVGLAIVGQARLAVTGAAASAARLVARGESESAIRSWLDAQPHVDGYRIDQATAGGHPVLTVTTWRGVRLGLLGTVRVSGAATALPEPGA